MKHKIGQEYTFTFPQVSFIELCERFPEKKLFTFLKEKDSPDVVTGKELVHKIKYLGNILQQELAPQEKALLLLPQGLDYIYSLMTCFYANVIAIPLPFTDLSQGEDIVERINLIIKDSKTACIITDTYFKEFIKNKQAFSSVSIIDINELDQSDSAINEARSQAPEDIALLLYTSGSTSQPKGVMVSHSNLMSQAFIGATQWGINPESCIVSWMPQFHNFGLHFNILAPLLKGASSIILSPSSFIKNPEDWFRTIDQYQATHTAAPNFAFDYCYSSIDITSIKDSSMHSLQAIICGGEPVRKETCENFISKYQGLGLEKNVFCPHYGLS